MKKGLIYAPISLVRKIKNSVDELKIHKAQLQNEGLIYPTLMGMTNYVDSNGKYRKSVYYSRFENLPWAYSSDEKVFYVDGTINGMFVNGEVYCERYEYANVIYSALQDGQITSTYTQFTSNPRGMFIIKDLRYTTVDDFVSANKGVLIFWTKGNYIDLTDSSMTYGLSGSDFWDATKEYSVGSMCIYQGCLYRCLVTHMYEKPTDTTYWTRVSLASLSEKVYKNRLRSRVDISSMTSYTPETDGYVYILNGSSTTKTLSIDGYIGLGGTVGNFSMFVKGGCSITVSGSGGSAYFSPLSY